MLAAYAGELSEDRPLEGLVVGEQPEPVAPPGWRIVTVRAAALNRHDIFALQGVALRNVPMILGTDASGVDEDGNEVVIHAVISSDDWRGDETLDPRRSLLSEVHPGTFAQRVAVPARNLIPKPPGMSFEEAACLPTAWLTAYRMLFRCSNLAPGGTVLIQGAGGGVTTALISLASAAGYRVWVTSRSAKKRERAVEMGAHETFDVLQRLPDKVDAVMDSVGEATWKHSIQSLRPGGTLVTCGATSGYTATTELNRIFFLQLNIAGATMGNSEELRRLVEYCDLRSINPTVSSVLPLSRAEQGFRMMQEGDLFGKIVFSLAV